MSSDLQSVIQGLMINNYVSLAMATVVVCDYLLTFPNEVEYVWSKPWTWVSTAYVLVRYLGLYIALEVSFVGTTFVPGPVKVSTGIIFAGDWAFAVFIAAADLVMVMRVYAMWNRSKVILYILLVYYVVEVIIQVVCTAIFDNLSAYSQVIVSQVLDYSICYATFTIFTPYYKYTLINTTVFDALLVFLALFPSVKQSISMYKATKQWQPNRYMALIVREGVAYIFLNSLNNITNLIEKVTTNLLTTTWLLVLGLLSVITLYPVIPRFIISIRELYESDTLGRRQGIDTGFGTSTGRNTVVSDIAFANDERGGDVDGGEELQLEEVGDGTRV